MKVGLQRSVVIGRAAKRADPLLEPANDLAPLLGEFAEHLDELRDIGILGRALEAVGAVDRGGDQAVQNGNVMIVRHAESFP